MALFCFHRTDISKISMINLLLTSVGCPFVFCLCLLPFVTCFPLQIVCCGYICVTFTLSEKRTLGMCVRIVQCRCAVYLSNTYIRCAIPQRGRNTAVLMVSPHHCLRSTSRGYGLGCWSCSSTPAGASSPSYSPRSSTTCTSRTTA